MKVCFLFLSEHDIHVTCNFFSSIVLKRYMLYLNMPQKNRRFTRKSYWGPLSLLLKQRFLSFSEVSTVHFIASYFLVSEYIQQAERRAHKTLRIPVHSYSLTELYYQCLSNYCKSWSRWKECCNSTADWKRGLKHMWGFHRLMWGISQTSVGIGIKSANRECSIQDSGLLVHNQLFTSEGKKSSHMTQVKTSHK